VSETLSRQDSGDGDSLAVPPQVVEILRSPVIAHLATCRDGTPHATPVWVICRSDTHLEVNIASMSKKASNVRLNRAVCLSMVAPHDARLWVVVMGTVSNVQEVADTQHLDELAQQYLGRPRRHPELPRQVLTIRPTRVHWWAEIIDNVDPAW